MEHLTFASFNVQRAGRSKRRDFTLLRRIWDAKYRWDFLGLQECQNIDFSSSWFQKLGYQALPSRDGKAAVVYRCGGTIRDSWVGDRWSAILFGQVLFIAAYLPDASVPDASFISDNTLRTLSLTRQYVARKYGHIRLVVSVDANVELTPSCHHDGVDYTGGGLAPVLQGIEQGSKQKERRILEEELRENVEGWMLEEKVKAANTFGRRQVTWFSYARGGEDRAKVLDYVFVPWDASVTGVTTEMMYEGTLRRPVDRISDHSLVCAELAMPKRVIARRYLSRRSKNLSGWEPVDWPTRNTFRSLIDVTAPRCSSLEQLQSDVYNLAASTECKRLPRNIPPKRPSEIRTLDREILERRVLEKGTAALRELRRRRLQLTRQFTRELKEWEISHSRVRRRPLKSVMIGEEKVQDRERWWEEVKRVGEEDKDVEERTRSETLLQDLRGQIRTTGVPQEALLTMAIVFRARARLRAGKATGPDGLGAEILRELPWRTVRALVIFFNSVFIGERLPPRSWCETLTSLMPKCMEGCTVDNTRKLAVESVVKKWYSTCVMIAMEPHVLKIRSTVSLFGFVPGRSCAEVTASIKTAAQHASIWGKDRKILIGSADVRQAFQTTTIANVKRAMDVLEVPPWYQYGILAPLVGEITTLTFEGLAVENVEVDRHIRTGGNESPELWNLVVCAMWASVIASWDEEGVGYACFNPNDLGERTAVVNHLFYADNVFVLGSDVVTFQRQLTDLTLVLRDWGFEWKPESLEFIAVGFDTLARSKEFDTPVPDFTVNIGGSPTKLKRVQALNVLGNDVAADYRLPHTDLSRRLLLAQRAFFANQDYFRTRAVAWGRKCKRYVSIVQSVLIYGTEGFTWDADSIHRLHVFEGRCLYRMAACRKPDSASWSVWKPAVLDKLRSDFMKLGIQPAVQRVLSRLWSLGRDVAGYFSTDWDPAYATCPADGKRRRLLPGCQVSSCRARQDARRLLMCSTTEWERRRSDASEALRGWGRYCQNTSLKRRRRGGVAAGERSWCHMFDVMYGGVDTDWWKSCDFSYASFVSCARDFLAHCRHARAFEYFIIRGVGGGGRDRDEHKEGCEHLLSQSLSGPAADKTAKRMAIINERTTVWDLCDAGVGLELCGDSLLVTNWTAGIWKVGGGAIGEGFRYQDRVDRVVTKLDVLSKMGVRPSSWGRDFTKHEYRESNGRADALTHKAREGGCFRYLYPERAFPICDRQYFELIGLRGKYDGGVDASGVGIGWWLQVGLIPISFHLPHSPQHEHVSKRARLAYLYPQTSTSCPILWRDVGECADCLPASSTITDAELSALEGLLEAAETVVHILGPRGSGGEPLLSSDCFDREGSLEPGTPAQTKT